MAEYILSISVYHPYDTTYSVFNTKLDSILNSKTNCDIIMGGDMNAQVGGRDCTELDDVLEPFGLEKRDEKGKDLLGVYQDNKLCMMNTYFEHPNYVTFVSQNKEKSKCTLDMISVS